MTPTAAGYGILGCVLVVAAFEPLPLARGQTVIVPRTLADCYAIAEQHGQKLRATAAVSCTSTGKVSANCRTISNPKGYPVTRVYCVWERPEQKEPAK